MINTCMWEKYRNQILMAIAGTVLTGIVGFSGKALLDSYLHTNSDTHITPEHLKDINDKLVQIQASIDKNEQSLRYVRFYYLNDRYSELDDGLKEEWTKLRTHLYPFGGAPEPK